MKQIKRKVTHRLCPDCGYVMTQLEIDRLRFPVECPRCGKWTTNAFQPIRWESGEHDEN